FGAAASRPDRRCQPSRRHRRVYANWRPRQQKNRNPKVAASRPLADCNTQRVQVVAIAECSQPQCPARAVEGLVSYCGHNDWLRRSFGSRPNYKSLRNGGSSLADVVSDTPTTGDEGGNPFPRDDP